MAAALVLFAVAGIAATSSQYRQKQIALDESQMNLYVSLIRQAESELSLGRPDLAEEALYRCPESYRQWEWFHLWRRSHREPVTFGGHPGRLVAMHYSPDGMLVATGSEDGTVIIREAATGRERVQLADRHLRLTAVGFTGGGRYMVTAAGDQTVRLWDAATGQQLQELVGVGEILATDHDDQFAAAKLNGVVTVWKVRHTWFPPGALTEKIAELPGEGNAFRVVALAPDGSRLAVAGFSRFVTVRNLTTGRETLVEVPGDKPTVHSVCFGPDGKAVAVGADDLREYDAETGRELGELSESGDFVCVTISYSPDGKHVAATDRDGMVRVWERPRGRSVLGTGRQQGRHPARAIFNPVDGRFLAVARERGVTIADLNPEPEPARRELRPAARRVAVATGPAAVTAFAVADARRKYQAVAFSPDGKWLAARARTGDGAAISLWDVPTGRQVHTLMLPEAADAGLAFTPDGARLVSAGKAGQFRAWHVGTWREDEHPVGDSAPLKWIAFDKDGPRVATSQGRRIEVWDWKDPKGRRQSWKAGDEVFGLCFRPNSKAGELLSFGLETKVECWDRSGQLLRNYRGHGRTAAAAAYSPKGDRLATASADLVVRVWDPDDGKKPLHELKHPGYVAAVAFSPDGRRLATGCSDGTVRVWDPEDDNRLLLTLTGHNGLVTGVAFSPDGRWIATCSRDGTLYLWEGDNLLNPLRSNTRNSP
jgi:WD40 repeat protein